MSRIQSCFAGLLFALSRPATASAFVGDCKTREFIMSDRIKAFEGATIKVPYTTEFGSIVFWRQPRESG